MNAVRLPEPGPQRRRQARIVIPREAPTAPLPQNLIPPVRELPPPKIRPELRPAPPVVRLNPPAQPTPFVAALLKARRALTGMLTLSLLMLAAVYMSTVQLQQSWAADYKALNQIRQQTRQMQTATGLLEGNLANETNHPAPFQPARPERVVLLPLLAPDPTTSAPSDKTVLAEPTPVPLGY
jgi:hypothetical protein